jgi:hypothetical protein
MFITVQDKFPHSKLRGKREIVMKGTFCKWTGTFVVSARILLVGLYAACVLVLLCIASPATAARWHVVFPNDVEYTKCKIFAYSNSGHYGSTLLTKGNSWTWAPPSGFAITYVSGRCQPDTWGEYYTEIQNRVCDGQDTQGWIPGEINCSHDVTVKICKKGEGIGANSHGFCSLP